MTSIALYCIVFSRSCNSQSFQGHVFISASQVIIAAAATLMPSAEKEKAERERKHVFALIPTPCMFLLIPTAVSTKHN